MKWILISALLLLLAPFAAAQGTTVFNCGGSNGWSTATKPANGCGVQGEDSANPVPTTNFWCCDTGSDTTITNTSVLLVPANAPHDTWTFVYGQAVNDTAFTTTFTFDPDAGDLAFVINNFALDTEDQPWYAPWMFNAGAGSEAGFSQFAGGDNISPTNLFAVDFDWYQNLNADASGWTYSGVQIYQSSQSPEGNGGSEEGYLPLYPIDRVSTSPVPMASAQGSPSKDTFSATITYTGTVLTVNLFDVTAGGSCPGASCFTYTWYQPNIPGIAGQNTIVSPTDNVGEGYVGLTAGTNLGTGPAMYIYDWSFTSLSAAATPTASPSGGIYSGTQSVTLSDSSSGAIICYSTTGLPATNGSTGCAIGTLYTGTISVPSGETVYAVAGGAGYGDSPVTASAYKIGSTASQPTFNPSQGTYQGDQTVYLTAAQGSVICYNTTGSPATNGSTGCTTGTLYSAPITVSSNETIYAVAGGTGYGSDSAVGSAAYVVNPFAVYGGRAAANSPTFSPAPGAYSGTQTVTLSTTTPGAVICYEVASSPPQFLPQPNNGTAQLPPNGSDTNPATCNVGTAYTGPITVSSSETIYADTGTTFATPPSSVAEASYTINGPAPGAPTNVQAAVVPQ